MDATHISAVILAAGFSSRMGAFKPLLPLGPHSLVSRSMALFKAAGVEDIVVVTGHRSEELVPFIGRHGARAVFNPMYDRGMYSSVQTGAAALSAESQGFFMLPVDTSLVRPVTVNLLLERFETGDASILYPVFQGRRGHPPLIRARHIPHILTHSGTGGLKALLKEHENEAREVETPDEHILFDVDTPEAYSELLRRFEGYGSPTHSELEILVDVIFGLTGELLNHSRETARIASGIADALNDCGLMLDCRLIFASGFLHDIAKGRPDHARVGADILRRMGFTATADVVEAHTDFSVRPDEPMTEKEIVYLADKLLDGGRVVSLAERFNKARVRCGQSAKAYAALCVRYENALKIKLRIEDVVGRPLESILESIPRRRDYGANSNLPASARRD
jgi:molybdenum cofactor cytidylyltransferase